jgi:transcriptional regulator with XRE-family HTH domain
MKLELNQRARQLRKYNGYSLGKIANILNVSKSSVSLWVRDIELTDEQKRKLDQKNPTINHSIRSTGHNNSKQYFHDRRLEYQLKGKEKAKCNSNDLHLIGCMLYWAEGGKSRNALCFTNSDIDMMQTFIRFLRDCYSIENNKIHIQITCYDDINTTEDIENYWLGNLGLIKDNLWKTIINPYPKLSTSKRHGKLPFGVCRIRINDVELIQNIYGAIQEYCNIQKEEWVL